MYLKYHSTTARGTNNVEGITSKSVSGTTSKNQCIKIGNEHDLALDVIAAPPTVPLVIKLKPFIYFCFRREPNFKSNLSASLACRWMTVATLRDIATLLDSVELRGSKVQVGSLSACIAGGLAVTAGLGLTLSGVGSPVGIPLLVGGAAVGGSGAIGG